MNGEEIATTSEQFRKITSAKEKIDEDARYFNLYGNKLESTTKINRNKTQVFNVITPEGSRVQYIYNIEI